MADDSGRTVDQGKADNIGETSQKAANKSIVHMGRDDKKYKKFLYFHYINRHHIKITDKYIVYKSGQLFINLIDILSDGKINITNSEKSISRMILKCGNIVQKHLRTIFGINSEDKLMRYLTRLDSPEIERLYKTFKPYYKELINLYKGGDKQATEIVRAAIKQRFPPKVVRSLPMPYTSVKSSAIATLLNNTFRTKRFVPIFYGKFANLLGTEITGLEPFSVENKKIYEEKSKHKSRRNIKYNECGLSLKTGRIYKMDDIENNEHPIGSNLDLSDECNFDDSYGYDDKPSTSTFRKSSRSNTNKHATGKSTNKRSAKNKSTTSGMREKISKLHENAIMKISYEVHTLNPPDSNVGDNVLIQSLKEILYEHRENFIKLIAQLSTTGASTAAAAAAVAETLPASSESLAAASSRLKRLKRKHGGSKIIATKATRKNIMESSQESIEKTVRSSSPVFSSDRSYIDDFREDQEERRSKYRKDAEYIRPTASPKKKSEIPVVVTHKSYSGTEIKSALLADLQSSNASGKSIKNHDSKQSEIDDHVMSDDQSRTTENKNSITDNSSTTSEQSSTGDNFEIVNKTALSINDIICILNK